MRLRYVLTLLLFALPRALADGLPDLGDVSQSSFSPVQERRLGERIMREIRNDRSFYDDPEATDYVNSLGNRLVTRGSDTRQEFYFFLINENNINAFALPGGFIGVHTGLILAAQSESELAGVLAHEIAHVTQRHIARMLEQQKQSAVTSLAALAVAILASRASSEAAQAALVFGQAGMIQSQLNFTRENEREADRVGIQILERSGFDPRGMPVFFERLQRATRLYETAGAPSYLRTHPLTFERIADVQNRIENLPYRQVPDSLEFQLVRAKLRAQLDQPRQAVQFFEESLAQRKFLSEAASRYGLVASLTRTGDYARARAELATLRGDGPRNAIVENLACRLLFAAKERDLALACYREALRVFPAYRALTYDYAEALLDGNQPAAALTLVEAGQQRISDDYRLYFLAARANAMLNRPFAQHRAQGEAYARLGNLTAAVEQLQIALKAGGGDFYQMSSVEARLRELRPLADLQRKEALKP
jgi:beta-barrel assembly-enhancing protease